MERFQFYHRIGSGSSKKGHENFDHVPYARDANRVIAKALIEAGCDPSDQVGGFDADLLSLVPCLTV